MDFAFTEAEVALQQTVRDFAKKELAPKYIERSRSNEFPWDVWRWMGELGVTGIRVPEEWGGAEANATSVGIVAEEMARGDVNCAFLVFLDEVMADFVIEHGSLQQKEEWLPSICHAQKLLGFGLTEPECGSDAFALKTRAVRDGDDYIISGEKTSISAVMAVDSAVVVTRTDSNTDMNRLSTIIVPLNSPGITRYVLDDIGFRPIGRGTFVMDDVRVPRSNVLGQEGAGLHTVAEMFNYARAIVGVMSLGAAQSAMDRAMDYSKQRIAFGKPISKFEGVSFLIAEHLTRIEACRLLCYKTLWLKDQNMPHSTEASMTKWWGPEVSVDAIHAALLVHGHFGYTHDFPFGQLMHDVIGYQIGDGTAQMQKLRIMRDLIGPELSP